MMWWLQQSQAARDALSVDPKNLQDALTKFRLWVNRYKPTHVWANSPSFDYVILRSAMEHFNMMVPWHFSAERDVRTAKEFALSDDGTFPALPLGENTAHNALDDAIKQAFQVQYAYAKQGI